LKIITRKYDNKNNLLRHIFHTDPDLLSDCDNRIEFSAIVSDIYIDGVWKTTSNARLENTDKFIIELMKKDNAGTMCRFMDLGASSGITTIESAEKISKAVQAPIKYYLLDRYFYLLKYKINGFSEYRTSNEEPVFLKIGCFGIRLPVSEHKHAFISNILAGIYLSFSKFRKRMILDSKLPLFTSDLLSKDVFEVIEQDCLNMDLSENTKFEYIRASNILNKAYFSDEQIKKIIKNLKQHLEDKGYLIVSRNLTEKDEPSEIISIWQNNNNKLELLSTFNGGSEIDDVLVDN